MVMCGFFMRHFAVFLLLSLLATGASAGQLLGIKSMSLSGDSLQVADGAYRAVTHQFHLAGALKHATTLGGYLKQGSFNPRGQDETGFDDRVYQSRTQWLCLCQWQPHYEPGSERAF